MDFLAEISKIVNQTIATSEANENSITITYMDGTSFKTTYDFTNLKIECWLEGTNEIIEENMTEWIKVCFSFNEPEKLTSIKSTLIEQGEYTEKTLSSHYYIKYQEGYLYFEYAERQKTF